MLTRDGGPLIYMYNGLRHHVDITHVVVEKGTDKKTFLKNRIKRLGYIKVSGQILFQLIVPKLLVMFSTKRIADIIRHYNLDNTPIPDEFKVRVDSVNSEACIAFLQEEAPALVIVNGTRIISKKVLESVNAVFLNTHGGITPKYRGVFGGYWAVANRDKDNFGVTVHLVDKGIDTGGIILQKIIPFTSKDNIATYPYLMGGEGIRLMGQAIASFMSENLETQNAQTKQSNLYHTLTLRNCLYRRIRFGAK